MALLLFFVLLFCSLYHLGSLPIRKGRNLTLCPVNMSRMQRQKSGNDGWTGDDDQKDPIIRQLSASRTRSWVASQNSLVSGSGQWETEVEEFIRDSSDLEGDNDLTPRAPSQQKTAVSPRPSLSRNSLIEESGRTSRAIGKPNHLQLVCQGSS